MLFNGLSADGFNTCNIIQKVGFADTVLETPDGILAGVHSWCSKVDIIICPNH